MSKTTTSKQTNEPPKWAKPLLVKSADEALDLYKKDSGFNSYKGDRVANVNTMQSSALNSMANAGQNFDNADMRAAGSQYDRLMSGTNGVINAARDSYSDLADGETATSDAALNAYGRLQNGTNTTTQRALGSLDRLQSGTSAGANAAAGILNRLQQQGQPQSAAEQYLISAAAGDNLFGDARFNEMLDRQSQKIADQVGQQFNAAGRYNSGANQAVLASNVGDFRRNTVLDNYAQERQRQLAAVSQIDAARQAGFGNQLQLAGAQGSLGQQQFSNQTNNAAQRAALGQQQFSNQSDITGQASALGQQLFNNKAGIAGQRAALGNQIMQNQMAAGQAQQGLGNQLFANQLTGANAALQAGTFKQRQAQAEIDANMQAFKERDMVDWTRLGALQAAASGAAGPYGMMTSTQQTPFNPLGILGALGGIFSSDSRLKTGIKRVGEAKGFPIYEFAYRTAPHKRYRGVMAQDVIKTRPDAISYTPDGMMMVNYAALGLMMEAA